MSEVNTLSFPGLGIGEFQVNKIAFTLFGRTVAWYGIIVTLAIISVCAVVFIKAKKAGISTDDILDYFIFSIVFGVIGARLYYVLFHGIGNFTVTEGSFWEKLTGTLYNIVAVWEGGLAIYGGVIAAAITVVVVSRIKHISFLKILDMAGHAALLGQAIGRWGNFMNAEAHGVETDIFCRMGIKNAFGITHYYHPTFLYESLWNILGFALIFRLLKHKKYDGQAFLWYVTWYGFGRMLIEGLRTDSLYIGNTGIRVSQLLAFCLFIGGAVTLVVLGIRRRGASVRLADGADGTSDVDDGELFTDDEDTAVEDTDSAYDDNDWTDAEEGHDGEDAGGDN